jgi:hypothetical protein
MKISAALKLVAFACSLVPAVHAAPQLQTPEVTLVSALAADETLGHTLTVSINELANSSLAKRVAEKVRAEAARAGYARVCIVQVERDGVSSQQSVGGPAISGVVGMPDGSAFSMPSAGVGFKLRRVSAELVVREVIKKAASN